MKKIFILLLLLSLAFCNTKTGLHYDEIQIVNSEDHYKIHTGKSYFVKGIYDSMSNGGARTYFIEMPSTSNSNAHFSFIFETELESTITIYSYAVASNKGTKLTDANRDTNIVNGANLAIYIQPTMSNIGVQVSQYKTGSGKKSGGTSGEGREVIIHPGKNFYLVVSNNSTADNWVDYFGDWYEESI